MSQKQLLVIVIGLVLLNIVTIMVYVIKPLNMLNESESAVASIGKVDISREEWMTELEARYGKEILDELVDAEVIQQTAKRYDVQILAADVEREYQMTKLTYSPAVISGTKSEKEWKQQIRSNMLLEEILTKDVTIPEATLRKFYEVNQQRFNLPESYRVSHIITASKEDAEQVLQELKDGSGFELLAMEKSLDEFTASQGGDLGYLTVESGKKVENYILEAKSMKENTWSEALPTPDGYAIVYLQEKVEAKQYSFLDVKKQIHRELALEQIKMPVTGKIFWEESDVNWRYEEGKE